MRGKTEMTTLTTEHQVINAYEVNDGASMYWEVYNSDNHFITDFKSDKMGEFIAEVTWMNLYGGWMGELSDFLADGSLEHLVPVELVIKTEEMYHLDFADEIAEEDAAAHELKYLQENA